MDKTGCFLTGVIAGAIALGVTAFVVDGLDGGFGSSSLPEPDESGSGKPKEDNDTDILQPTSGDTVM